MKLFIVPTPLRMRKASTLYNNFGNKLCKYYYKILWKFYNSDKLIPHYSRKSEALPISNQGRQ